VNVTVGQRGLITIVTLDHLEVRNAVDPHHAFALTEAVRAFDADPDAAVAGRFARVVIGVTDGCYPLVGSPRRISRRTSTRSKIVTGTRFRYRPPKNCRICSPAFRRLQIDGSCVRGGGPRPRGLTARSVILSALLGGGVTGSGRRHSVPWRNDGAATVGGTGGVDSDGGDRRPGTFGRLLPSFTTVEGTL
jgi:hypothetical protein